MNKFILLVLLLFTINNPSFSDIKPETKQKIDEVINKLDKTANLFKSIKCSVEDELCWWFLFHVYIGDNGHNSMQNYIQKIPIKNGRLFGEGHVFQFPAYSLLKGVSVNTILSNGLVLGEYIRNKDWLKEFYFSEDKEPSWYILGKYLYEKNNSFLYELPQLASIYKEEKACFGSHYLVASSIDKSNSYTKVQIKIYVENLRKLLSYTPEEILNDPSKTDLILHSFETLCLTSHRWLIDYELFEQNIKFFNFIDKKFQSILKYKREINLQELLEEEPNVFYALACMLGHFRFGLKVCAEKEPNRL